MPMNSALSNTPSDAVGRSVRKHSKKVALTYADRQWTYAALGDSGSAALFYDVTLHDTVEQLVNADAVKALGTIHGGDDLDVNCG